MAPAALRPFLEQRSGGVDIETAPPGVALIIAVGDPYRVGIGGPPTMSAPGGFVVGPQSRYGSSALSGTAEGVQVELSWSAAATVFGAQLADLADQAVPVTALAGGTRLVDHLNETPVARWAPPIRGWLGEAAETNRGPSPLALRALQRIESGGMSVGALAAELGCSRGHLHRVVRAATGQSPTTLIRIVRLHRLLDRRDAPTLADRAVAAGFADHAHLCHETRRLAGRTPGELFSTQVT